jgi:CheY-like chemotaxis protein
MPRVRLLHWNAQEAAAHIEILRRARHRVEYDEQFRPALMKNWRQSPPDAFVIDLSRLLSQGREIAIALRQSPSTRLIPIVFCGGKNEKVEELRKILPDAAYCTLPSLSLTLETALRDPPANPVRPPPMRERYQGRTAAQKLGIAASSTLRLMDPPPNALKSLGELPPGVQIVEDSFADNATGRAVTLCFVHECHSLAPAVSQVRSLAATSKLWILWRKGGSAARGDLTENLVRRTALDLGLVDYKICSVDATWSAMLFACKK